MESLCEAIPFLYQIYKLHSIKQNYNSVNMKILQYIGSDCRKKRIMYYTHKR